MAQLFSLGSIEHLLLTTPQNYEKHSPVYLTLDAVCILRFPFIHGTFRIIVEQSRSGLVEACVFFIPSDVFLFRRLCDMANAEGASRVAEAGHGFTEQEVSSHDAA